MTSVHVILRLPEYPNKLIRNLRSRGYEVQTLVASAFPGEFVEVSLEYVGGADVAEACSTAHGDHAAYFVSEPGVQNGQLRSLRIALVDKNGEAQRADKLILPMEVMRTCFALLRQPSAHGANRSASARIRERVSAAIRVRCNPIQSVVLRPRLGWRGGLGLLAAMTSVFAILYLSGRLDSQPGRAERRAGENVRFEQSKIHEIVKSPPANPATVSDERSSYPTALFRESGLNASNRELQPGGWDVEYFAEDVTIRRHRQPGPPLMPQQRITRRVVTN